MATARDATGGISCGREKNGRSGVIRTLDPHVPNVVRYQTALHSVTSGASIDQRFSLHKHGNEKSGEKVEVFLTATRMSLNSLPEAL